MPNPWLILGFTLALGLAVWGAYSAGHANGVAEEDQRWALASEEQKKEAAKELATKAQKVIDLERQLSQMSAEADKKEEDHRDELFSAYNRARRDVERAGGLRDSGHSRRGNGCDYPRCSDATTTPSAQPATAAGQVLSDEAAQFLFEFAREADQLNIDFERARADAQQCRGVKQ